MPKQLLPRGGELQESERLRNTPGDDPTRPQALQPFRGMAWHLGEERQDEKLVMKSIPETWASGTRGFRQSFSFTERNTCKPCS